MTKELRGFINRVRKAQDKIYEGKSGMHVSMDVAIYQRYIRIDAFRQSPEDRHVLQHEQLIIFSSTTAQDISESLSRMSQIVGFDI